MCNTILLYIDTTYAANEGLKKQNKNYECICGGTRRYAIITFLSFSFFSFIFAHLITQDAKASAWCR
jgi:hypothetical protein